MDSHPSLFLSLCYKHASSASSLGTVPLQPPTAPFVWPTSHFCHPLSLALTWVCNSPLLFINTSLSYLFPSPPPLGLAPIFPTPITDITTVTGSNQVSRSIQQIQSAKRCLPMFPVYPVGLPYPLVLSAASPVPSLLHRWALRPLTHHVLSYSNPKCAELKVGWDPRSPHHNP